MKGKKVNYIIVDIKYENYKPIYVIKKEEEGREIKKILKS